MSQVAEERLRVNPAAAGLVVEKHVWFIVVLTAPISIRQNSRTPISGLTIKLRHRHTFRVMNRPARPVREVANRQENVLVDRLEVTDQSRLQSPFNPTEWPYAVRRH